MIATGKESLGRKSDYSRCIPVQKRSYNHCMYSIQTKYSDTESNPASFIIIYRKMMRGETEWLCSAFPVPLNNTCYLLYDINKTVKTTSILPIFILFQHPTLNIVTIYYYIGFKLN